MESSPQAVSPVSPPAAYIGGKRALARTIVPLLDSAAEVTTYAEPFVGMGGVFLRRTVRPPAEVVNDASREVATFFRILQRHYPQFMGSEGYYGRDLFGRADFERLAAALRGLRARWLLSLNDRPEVRALFAWAEVCPVRTVWTAGGGAGKAASELLISNWPLPPP